jgi:hypothetical protein
MLAVETDPRYVRPSEEVIDRYLLGTPSEHELEEVLDAIAYSPEFGAEMREMLRDMERLESPEVQAQLANPPRVPVPDFSVIIHSRLSIRLHEITSLAQLKMEGALASIASLVHGLAEAGSTPIGLTAAPAFRSSSAGAIDLMANEEMAEAFAGGTAASRVQGLLASAITRGRSLKLELPGIGPVLLSLQAPEQGVLEIAFEGSEFPRRLEFWRRLGENLERIESVAISDGKAVIPLKLLAADVYMCFAD